MALCLPPLILQIKLNFVAQGKSFHLLLPVLRMAQFSGTFEVPPLLGSPRDQFRYSKRLLCNNKCFTTVLFSSLAARSKYTYRKIEKEKIKNNKVTDM